MESKKIENAYHFWCRVDELRGKRELLEIATSSGIKYKSMLVQRSNTTFPKAQDLVALAKDLNTTVEWLVSGESSIIQDYNLKIIRNNQRLYGIAVEMVNASERQLVAMEVLLNINPVMGVDKSMA
jgi:hypothetical protein